MVGEKRKTKAGVIRIDMGILTDIAEKLEKRQGGKTEPLGE